ncbi:ribosome assembly cofactor RimP [Crocinitomicaceae bacterium]|nr:ribosome assembly cofactor RimP [Crocinitomicaceae bacterium]|tara:strand:+ start:10 stop:486 length:477 start_codon:yes stop_codon:yes gene_type:complete
MISKKKVADLIYERIEELDNGLFVVTLNISSANSINVELDKHEGNVSVKDCMSVSRNVEHNLDREEEDFQLHVSSAGLDNGLRVFAQYKKNIGRNVKVKLHDGEDLEGKMIDATPDKIIIQTSRQERIEGKKKKQTIVEDIELAIEKVKETKIIISFK